MGQLLEITLDRRTGKKTKRIIEDPNAKKVDYSGLAKYMADIFLEVNKMDHLREECSKRMGEFTSEEWEYAKMQLARNNVIGNTDKLYDSTSLDMLITNIDFVRRHKLLGDDTNENKKNTTEKF